LLDLSKHFKNDIITPNQTLLPVVIITDTDGTILHSLSTHTLTLNDNIKTKPIIQSVSKVRISTDYDKKKLKINTLRCELYNYYDVKDRFTDIYSLTSKTLYLFYKSPTTNTINIDSEPTDYDCALLYKGEINRIEHNESKISILAEDSTQIKISDKDVPYMAQDKLTQDIRENILEEYKDDDITIPMVFGKVDKAPTLPYLDTNDDRIMNILFDIHPTTTHHKTAKIPSVMKMDLPIDNDYYLYILKDKDYVIWNTGENTYNYQNLQYSQTRVVNTFGSVQNHLLPELQEELNGFGLWDVHGLIQRQVESVSAGSGSIIEILENTIEDSQGEDFTNMQSINDNAGFERVWYRSEDEFTNYNPSYVTNFDTGMQLYASDSHDSGAGRWILLKLDKGISESLRNIKSGGNYIGNTFLAARYILSTGDINVTNSSTIPSDATTTGFFVCPISTQIWKDRIPEILANIGDDTGSNWHKKLLNEILIETDEQLIPNAGNYDDEFAPTVDTYINAPIQLSETSQTIQDDRYWNNTATVYDTWKKIQGLYYGESGSDESILTANANAHDYIAMFEFYPKHWHNSFYSYQQRLRLNNVGFLQSIHLENIREDEIYASITGRKSYYYTEEAESELTQQFELPSLEGLINGVDNSKPDFNLVFDAYYQHLRNQHYQQNDYTFQLGWMDTFDFDIDDSAMFRSFYLFKYFTYEVYRKTFVMWEHLHNQQGMSEYLSANPEQKELAFQTFYSETYIKSMFKRIYEYIYQTNIDFDYDFNITYLNPNWWLSFDGIPNQTPDEWSAGDVVEETLDLTSEINFDYSWDDFNNTTTEEWQNNLSIFMDDTIYTINRVLYNNFMNILFYPYYQEPNNLGFYVTYLYETVEEHTVSHPAYYNWSNDAESIGELSALQENLYFTHNQMLFNNSGLSSDGIIERPSDIVMNILTYELGYGRRIENQDISIDTTVAPDYSKFDMSSIQKSREAHANFKMGFAINETTDGKELIEKILSESKSYPKFNSNGKFGLITIKEEYTEDDIDKVIDSKHVMSYKISKTKREDVITSLKCLYRYDNGTEKYSLQTDTLTIEELLPEYTGFDSYNLTRDDGHKDLKLRYHVDTNTVNEFQRYTLLNECNVHNMITMTLPLSYIDISVGDVVHIPLINNELASGMDYSKVSYLNGQPVYPLWIVMETNTAIDNVSIKAYQLHYLGTDGDHKFGTDYEIIGNMNQFNTNYTSIDGNPLPNWNYNPSANVHNNIEVPYGDVSGDGIINVIDIIECINHVIGVTQLTSTQIQRITGVDLNNGNIVAQSNVVDILDITKLINMVTNE
tara:strand:+ start:1754 stop:5698 length:3945 start_codon:yes stop_codon:yes gene_type:complete